MACKVQDAVVRMEQSVSVRLKDLSLFEKMVPIQVSNFVFPDLTSITLSNQVWKDYC